MEMSQRAAALSDELGLTGRQVFFTEWVPYAERQNYLLEADIGVSLHFDHLETAFSFRTRLLDCLWAGLPVIATAGDSVSALVKREGLGLTIAPEDAAGAAQAVLRLAGDPALRAACRENLRRVAPAFQWDAAVAPLARFCAAPRITHRGPQAAVESACSALAVSILKRPWLARAVGALGNPGG